MGSGRIPLLSQWEAPDRDFEGDSLSPLSGLYSAVTAYLGFKVNSGEYKVMGLAPYGKTALFCSRLL